MTNLIKLFQALPANTIRLFWLNVGGYFLFILLHTVGLWLAKSAQSKEFHKLFIRLNFEVSTILGGIFVITFLVLGLVIYADRTFTVPHELQGGWVITFNVIFYISLGILAIIDIGMYFLEKTH